MTAKKTYRDLQDKLDLILNELQQPDVDVDRALSLYTQGLALIKELEAYLKVAENNIRKLDTKSNKPPSTLRL